MLKAVRDGKKSVLECPDCGCRLNIISFASMMDAPAIEYDDYGKFAHHFVGDLENTDAKGHKCKSIGRVWSLGG